MVAVRPGPHDKCMHAAYFCMPASWLQASLATTLHANPMRSQRVRLSAHTCCYVPAADHDGRTALHWAAYKGFADSCRLLLVLDARYALADKEGCTPLHWAAIKGNGEACTVLVQGGALSTLSARDVTGSTPPQLAVEKGHRWVQDALCCGAGACTAGGGSRGKDIGDPTLHCAAAKGSGQACARCSCRPGSCPHYQHGMARNRSWQSGLH